MSLKEIENKLREYRRKKSIVDIAKERISTWEYALSNIEMVRGLFTNSKPDDCWIRKFGSGSCGDSEVEFKIIEKEEYEEHLINFIREEKSRIFLLELETKEIEIALESVTKQEKYIIECKYFENMFWKDIEINFNKEFRSSNYIAEDGIKKIKKKAVEKIVEVLSEFDRYKIAS